MSIRKINHIAIAVPDLEAAREKYATLFGVQPGEIETVADQQVRLCFFEVGDSRIELISPLPENKGVNGFLEKRGPGLHHICLEVDNLEAALEHYKAAGLRLIDERPRVGAGGHRIAFVHPGSAEGVLLELEETG
ncbi:MAG: methylmalonyl-CoA epimerase [bacterium]